jgi:hypothetical protein
LISSSHFHVKKKIAIEANIENNQYDLHIQECEKAIYKQSQKKINHLPTRILFCCLNPAVDGKTETAHKKTGICNNPGTQPAID